MRWRKNAKALVSLQLRNYFRVVGYVVIGGHFYNPFFDRSGSKRICTTDVELLVFCERIFEKQSTFGLNYKAIEPQNIEQGSPNRRSIAPAVIKCDVFQDFEQGCGSWRVQEVERLKVFGFARLPIG